MSNFQVYRKILSFSLVMFLVDLLALVALIGASLAGFLIGNQFGSALIGLPIGFLVGILIVVIVNVFVTNRIKAAQIAIMTKGVVEGVLPEQPFKAGFEEIKGRFGKITAFFFIMRAIRGIFNQIGKTINRVGTAIGGESGDAITSAINSGVQTLLAYLCDCCLGWILYRKGVNAAKAGCEGAVIFFKHGKTLIRNVGRIFGMGLASFIIVGGIFSGIFYLIYAQFPQVFTTLANEVAALSEGGEGEFPEFLTNPVTFTAISAIVSGIFLWTIAHKVLVKPFILTGVLRNYMQAGLKDIPTESDFAELDSKSGRFAKLHNSF